MKRVAWCFDRPEPRRTAAVQVTTLLNLEVELDISIRIELEDDVVATRR